MESDLGGDESKGGKEQPHNDLPGVQDLLQDNPVKDCLRLYYHRVAIDVVVLVVGVTYFELVNPKTDMIPVYMIVRSALRLGCLPFNVAVEYQPSKDWKNSTIAALAASNYIIEIAIFGWLIYGTVIVSKRWPGSDQDLCDKPCYLMAFSTIVIDWVWRLLITFALMFPLCWFAVDQWTMALFFLYAGAKKSRKRESSPVQQM